MNDLRFLDMRGAGSYLGQSYRWMQRHYVDLIKAGVGVYRIPADAIKGRIMFSKAGLDRYMDSCRMQMPASADN